MRCWTSCTVIRVRVTFGLAGGHSQMVADRCPQLLPLVPPPDKNKNKAVLHFDRCHRRQELGLHCKPDRQTEFLQEQSQTQRNLKSVNTGNTCDHTRTKIYRWKTRRNLTKVRKWCSKHKDRDVFPRLQVQACDLWWSGRRRAFRNDRRWQRWGWTGYNNPKNQAEEMQTEERPNQAGNTTD